VGVVRLHGGAPFPLTAPPEHYYRYIGQELPRPKLYDEAERPDHPYVRMYARRSDYDTHINGPADLQRALAGYFGLVSFLDEQIGTVLTALSEAGLADTTRVIYTSDHGDNLGARGLWGKATMYEESAGIPMLVAGNGVPAGAVCATPVTLCDVSTTILDAVGGSGAARELDLPGSSLLDLAVQPTQNRTVLSEFHTYGPDAFYMLREPRHKYVYYVGAPPQLFDLEADPEELTDLGLDPGHAPQRREFEARLRAILDPELIDKQAKADQARMAERYGGFEMLRRREKMAFTPPPTASA
jgi:choline-sulfatase